MKPNKDKLSDLVSKTISAKKESKRTTFKLSQQSLNAIDWIVETYDIPAKEVFDIIGSSDEFKKQVIDIAKKDDENNLHRERKTFVISKQTLNHLNRTSEVEKIPRDILVEKMVLFYKALLEKHLEDEKQNEKEALKIITNLCSDANKIEEKLIDLLDDDNPIRNRIAMIAMIIEHLQGAIELKLTKGTPIDPDDFLQST